MLKIYVIIISLLLPIGLFGKKKGQKKIYVYEDAFVEAGENSSLNFGDHGDLRLQNPGKQNKYNREIYLKFKLKKVPEVKSAVLYVYGRAFPKNGKEGKVVDVAVQSIQNVWDEETIIWNNALRNGTDMGHFSMAQNSKPQWYSVVLDAAYIESVKTSGYLSLWLKHTSNSGIGASLFAKEKTWTDGASAGKEAYLVINGEIPDSNAGKLSTNQEVKADETESARSEFKMLVSADVMVQGGSKRDKVFANDPMVVNGSQDEEINSEVYLHFKTNTVQDKIDKAVLCIPVKALKGNTKLSVYDGKGRSISDATTCWKNKPNSGPFIGEIEVNQSDNMRFYELDMTSYAQKAHVIIDGNITLRIMDFSKNEMPVFIGSKEGDGYRSYLKLQTSKVDPARQAKSYNVVKPSYPIANKDEHRLEQWLNKHPLPKGYWVSELWKQYVAQDGQARLLDFSYAGYRYGEEAIPVKGKILGKITDFGAIPNDGKDDTDAIQRALDKLSKKRGVILFPKGRYIVNGDPLNPKQLKLHASKVVLRGEGSGEEGTVIHMTNKFLPAKGYGDFMLEIGKEELVYQKHATPITSESKRGQRTIEVKNAEKFMSGDYVKIVLYSERNDGKYTEDLGRTLAYPLEPEERWTNFAKYSPYMSVNQIKRVIDNNTVELVQPLKKDLLARWTPKMVYVKFYEEVGVEHMRFEGEWHGPYRHHGNREMDYGWCALGFNNIVNGWVKDVNFHNLTWDMKFQNTKNVTATNISVSGTDGHHGVVASVSWDLLVKDMVMHAHRTHNIGGGGMMEGCVFTNIEITDPQGQIDFHGGGFPMSNLFDNIKGACVAGAGATQNMPHAGRDNTFYNIIGKKIHKRSRLLVNEFFPEGFWNYYDNKTKRGGVSYECYKLYPGSLVIGVYKPGGVMQVDKDEKNRDNDFIYVEGLNQPNVWPVSLYEAQLEQRLNKVVFDKDRK